MHGLTGNSNASMRGQTVKTSVPLCAKSGSSNAPLLGKTVATNASGITIIRCGKHTAATDKPFVPRLEKESLKLSFFAV